MTLEAEGGSETYGFSAALPLPLAIDLYCGLGGWTDGLLSEGWTVIGFDIEAHDYGDGKRYPAHLVLQNVLTLHGAQFSNADLIVASPPCQEFSYRAMPWKRAKALPPPYLGMQLFWACFRIQQEASEAAGRYIPLVVENVCGAQRWVGDAKAHFGSYYLGGDVGRVGNAVVSSVPKFGQVVRANGSQKNAGGSWFAVTHNTDSGHSRNPVHYEAERAVKVPGFRFDGSGRSFQTASVDGTKVASLDGGRRTDVGKGARFTSRDCGIEGTKNDRVSGGWFKDYTDADGKAPRSISWTGSKSAARKAASAEIARIPFPLAQHIARVFKPEEVGSGRRNQQGSVSCSSAAINSLEA